jgi:hypothetical protein
VHLVEYLQVVRQLALVDQEVVAVEVLDQQMQQLEQLTQVVEEVEQNL